jgi:hypothetical protein
MPRVRVPGVMVIEDSIAAASKVVRARSGNSTMEGETESPGEKTSRPSRRVCSGTCHASQTT